MKIRVYIDDWDSEPVVQAKLATNDVYDVQAGTNWTELMRRGMGASILELQRLTTAADVLRFACQYHLKIEVSA